MNRYFRRSTKMDKIRAFIDECKLGDWFVLYQMSKNLNRPFFMDFLTCLSVRHALRGDADVDSDSDTGDNLMTMLLKPSYTAQDSQVRLLCSSAHLSNDIHYSGFSRQGAFFQ